MPATSCAVTSLPAPPIVERLDRLVAGLAGDGVHRSLASSGGDLNVNLAHLDPGAAIAAHVNDEIDVLFVVLAGNGVLHIDDTAHVLVASTLAYVVRGVRRSIVAGDAGLTYLTAHRARGPLDVTGTSQADDNDNPSLR